MWDLTEPSPNPPLTEEDVAAVQRHLDIKLPDDYVAALRVKNGGSIVGDFVQLPAQQVPVHLHHLVDNGHVAVRSINGIGESFFSILRTAQLASEWTLPEGLVLIDGDGHDWLAFDYRRSSSCPPIILIDSDSGDHLEVCDNFDSLFGNLVAYETLFDDDSNYTGDN